MLTILKELLFRVFLIKNDFDLYKKVHIILINLVSPQGTSQVNFTNAIVQKLLVFTHFKYILMFVEQTLL